MANQSKRSPSAGSFGGQLNFHHLYIFQMVASHLSFSRATEAMEITQPAVSIQVQELEKFLGTKLFQQRPRGLGITEAGNAALAPTLDRYSRSPINWWTPSKRWKTYGPVTWF